MSLTSKDIKKSMRKKVLEDVELQELEGWTHCVVGHVKKNGRVAVLSATKESKLYWLKEQYEKLLDNAQEVRMKRMPTKLAGDEEGAPIRVVAYLPNVRDEK